MKGPTGGVIVFIAIVAIILLAIIGSSTKHPRVAPSPIAEGQSGSEYGRTSMSLYLTADVCKNALDQTGVGWNTDLARVSYVREASNRGLSLEACRRAAGLQPTEVPSTAASSPTPRAAEPSPAPPDTAEVMPPVGSDLEFTRDNLRYCEYERQRLELSRTLIGGIALEGFNRAIDDWNSRCSQYQYRQADRSAVEAEIVAKQSEFLADARARAARWASAQQPMSTPGPSTALSPPAANLPPPIDITPQPAARTQAQPAANLSSSLDLLNVEDVVRIQNRLAELGFFKGPANGTWGPVSRQALRSFKIANGLSNNDRFDEMTGGKLLSSDAVGASVGQAASLPPIAETIYPAPNGANLNPLNKADAMRIHARLHELGFYNGKNETLWSGASRLALRTFKTKNGLPPDDKWDAQVELALFPESD